MTSLSIERNNPSSNHRDPGDGSSNWPQVKLLRHLASASPRLLSHSQCTGSKRDNTDCRSTMELDTNNAQIQIILC